MLANRTTPKTPSINAKDREDQAKTITATKTLNSLRRPAIHKKTKQTAEATDGLEDGGADEATPAEDDSTRGALPKAKAKTDWRTNGTPKEKAKAKAKGTPKAKAKAKPKAKAKAQAEWTEEPAEFLEVDDSSPAESGAEGNGDDERRRALLRRAIHKGST